MLGAHIIKVKPPTDYLETKEAKKIYLEQNIAISTLSERIAHIKRVCFNGKRIVVFSGGASKSLDDLFLEAEEIRNGGGNGSIIGRNSFQRPRKEALAMLKQLINIYLS